MMESFSSPGEHGRGLISVENQHKKEPDVVAKNSLPDSSLSASAEPFKSSSLNQSEKSQLSVMAKEFVPQKPATDYYTQPEATVLELYTKSFIILI